MNSERLEHQIHQQPAKRVAAVRRATTDVLAGGAEDPHQLSFEYAQWRWGAMWPIEWAVRMQLDDRQKVDDQ